MTALHENAAGLTETMAAIAGIEICREPWRIYYDETENCRSIAHRNGAIADARTVERPFILGGIAILGKMPRTSFRRTSSPSFPETGR